MVSGAEGRWTDPLAITLITQQRRIMGSRFEIGVGTSKDMLANQPQQYAPLNVLYTVFAARIGTEWFPASCWCDFAGIVLFRWYEAVWRLSAARNPCCPLALLLHL